jgi:hypothetical protein
MIQPMGKTSQITHRGQLRGHKSKNKTKTRKKHGADTLFFSWDGRTTFLAVPRSQFSFGENAVSIDTDE